ncbi:electron transport complex subunit RsxA [bacterium]|nr:electron transport complex subunit RsxA [bacterium]MBU1638090.1 electron transport complex subunit RsxA [bacterium]RQV99109.1 MAG: electron transport complex subunit RsxA [bacterium]
MNWFLIAISAIFVNNILLAQYLGNCPFMGVSKRLSTALGMGAAVIFVATLASVFTWIIYHYVMVPYGIEYMQTLIFILVIAALVQFVEIFLKKKSRAIYNALGIYLPLITTNCAVMGIALLNIKNENGFFEMLVFSFASAVGFSLALILFAGIRERMITTPIPIVLRGTAIALIMAGIMSLAFMGFAGMGS